MDNINGNDFNLKALRLASIALELTSSDPR